MRWIGRFHTSSSSFRIFPAAVEQSHVDFNTEFRLRPNPVAPMFLHLFPVRWMILSQQIPHLAIIRPTRLGCPQSPPDFAGHLTGNAPPQSPEGGNPAEILRRVDSLDMLLHHAFYRERERPERSHFRFDLPAFQPYRDTSPFGSDDVRSALQQIFDQKITPDLRKIHAAHLSPVLQHGGPVKGNIPLRDRKSVV